MSTARLLFDPDPQPRPEATQGFGPVVTWEPEERLLYGELWLAKGRDRAVPIRFIEKRTGLNERQVKQAARDLVMRHSLPIGAVREKDGGYYIIQNAEELEETVGYLRNQAISMLRRVYMLTGKNNARLRELLGQMELEITQ